MDALRDQLRTIYGARPWILASEVLAAATTQVATLRQLGVTEMLIIAGARGTGDVPEDVESVLLGVHADGMMQAIRAVEHALGQLPSHVVRQVARFDPDGQARVMASPFTHRVTVADRPVWGARWPAWTALEDKIVVDELWQAAGVAHADSQVVAADADALASAAADLDRGMGTVWVADNRQGWHGGATGLRWVRESAHATEAASVMSQRADLVRVMPFLDGVPCSIHGMVMRESVLAFRPCEMVVLRRPERSDLCYAGMGATWDPAPSAREGMRETARRIGSYLRDAVGYRGAFSIDGVMTADGFRPTELNPRFSAALNMLAANADIPLDLVNRAVVEAVDVDWDGPALEDAVVAAADASRTLRCHTIVPHELDPQTRYLRRDGGKLVACAEPEAEITLMCGPANAGSIVRVQVAPGVIRDGDPAAPVVCAALTWADAQLGLGLGPLEPATAANT